MLVDVVSKRRALSIGCALTVAVAMGACSSSSKSSSTHSTSGTQPAPTGSASGGSAGVGTAAALSAPNCDSATHLIKLPSYYTIPCVKPWAAGANNGGATAPGVTATSIDVVALVNGATDDKKTSPGVLENQATGQQGTEQDSALDEAAVWGHIAQTWGRTVHLSFVQSTGPDEAAQRADAITVESMHPFVVFDMAEMNPANGTIPQGGGVVFDQTLLNAGIPIVTAGGTGSYETMHENDDIAINAAGVVGRELAGSPAKWAGDASLQKDTRKFGVIYATGTNALGGSFPISLFNSNLSGAKATVEESYTLPAQASSDIAFDQQEAPTLVSKLKLDGVTTVVLFVDPEMSAALTNAAASQNYTPEWMYTGYSVDDLALYGKLNNQKEWAHAFGAGYLPPYVTNGGGTALIQLFDWYWGKNQGTQDAGTAVEVYPLYAGIQLAGPDLTRASFTNAIAAMPEIGGAASNSLTVGEVALAKPGLFHDFALVWWNSAKTGIANDLGNPQQGVEEYLDGGKRYQPGQEPKGVPDYFDAANSIVSYADTPAGSSPPSYPCVDCPSTGGGQAAAHVG